MPTRLAEVLGFVGANIRRARHKAGLSQEALGAEADLSVRFVQNLEVGKAAPSLKALVALANVLNVSIATFFRSAKLPKPRVGRPRTK